MLNIVRNYNKRYKNLKSKYTFVLIKFIPNWSEKIDSWDQTNPAYRSFELCEGKVKRERNRKFCWRKLSSLHNNLFPASLPRIVYKATTHRVIYANDNFWHFFKLRAYISIDIFCESTNEQSSIRWMILNIMQIMVDLFPIHFWIHVTLSWIQITEEID